MTGTPEIGVLAPDFRLPSSGGGELSLSDRKGRNLVLYFYPKDNTPGCTNEAIVFRDACDRFDAVNTDIIGISRDKIASHDRFRAKHDLPFPLVSDQDGTVCEAYGTWVEKSMYGRKYWGIERSTFLIDRSGILRSVWRKVRVPGHVDKVLAAASELS